jgi:CMP-N,N'-diacetyllegionaminic acid synthase
MSEDELKVLGLIPARGGSKGVPRKNIRPLAGRPLIGYTIAAALQAKGLERVLVSTDDEEIAGVARELGAWVPFIRPAELARDETPMLPVIRQALEWCEERGYWFDAVCLLQPTNPRRDGRLIDECIARFAASGADSLVTVLPVPAKYNPHWVYLETADGGLRLSTGEDSPLGRRQDLPPAWHREGSVYLTRRRTLVEEQSLYGTRTVGYPIDPAVSVNIDSFDDWARAERLLSRCGGDG